FKRVDRYTGDTRYIYHGNDGTHMPWNDTAQLDHLKHEVRQAVIDLTLHVAEKFPIIRFDAAMTLAKKHFQRLWYPVPGFGGDIPSRSGQGISSEEFNRLFPIEFWRELVDRVAAKAPNTLLLAEAFWLMEGYFVRSLGMHRVYNSAFMNMLKAEENSKYRDVIKNVLRFNPEILRRFVNFMNNPDEEPAVDQFGKGDKYFGVATMMVTMPGLPMFGHGQVEGFSEKYGMEYRKAYWNETVDEDLVRRHEQEIFPLMRKRHLFSGVEHFVFYDCVTNEGWVNEDVFAYSNRSGEERALVVYNNRYAEAQGRIRTSVGMSVETEGRRRIRHASLGEGLGFKDEDTVFYLFEDQKSGMEYIRSGRDLCRNGLFIHLCAFKSNVFLNFREVYDDAEGHYQRLNAYLAGAGVPDINSAFLELILEKLLGPLRQIVDPQPVLRLVKGTQEEREALLVEVKDPLRRMISEAGRLAHGKGDVEKIALKVDALLAAVPRLSALAESFSKMLPLAQEIAARDERSLGILVMWTAVHRLGEVAAPEGFSILSRTWLDEWMLIKVIGESLRGLGCNEGEARRHQLLIKILTEHQGFGDGRKEHACRVQIARMIKTDDVQQYLGFNVFEGTTWFNRESFESLVEWMGLINIFKTLADYPDDMSRIKEMLKHCHSTVRSLIETAAASDYKVESLSRLLGE
ncbi:MAG TPA: alpha-amylase, partial [Deltaproteobacteria bacterium]|nr:alpha-amylase [Deltaproteobacteria bacterium]